MKFLTTYLTFDGNCREAMSFYAKCLGAEIQLMAAFYDGDENLVCSGVISNLAIQTQPLQTFNFDLRLRSMIEPPCAWTMP